MGAGVRLNFGKTNKSLIWHLRSTALAITVCLAFFSIYSFFITSVTYWKYPPIIDYGEGCVLTFLYHLKIYGNYFFPLNDYPYSYSTYPPLFMVLSRLINFFIPSPLQATRFLSTLASFGSGFVLFLIIQYNTRKRIIAFLGMSLFFATWFVHLFAPLGRVDTLVSFFSLLGLLSFQKHADAGQARKYLSFFFFACAFFTKQSALFAPASVLLYALIHPSQRKFFLKYFFCYITLIAAGLAFLYWRTGGEALKHLFLYTSERSFNWMAVIVYSQSFLCSTFMLWILVFLFFLFPKKIISSSALIYLIYFTFNILLIPAPAATSGNMNYFIDPLVAMILFASISASHWMDDQSLDLYRKHFRELTVLLGVLAYLVVTIQVLVYIHRNGGIGYDYPMGTRYPWISREYKNISEFVRKAKGDVLCEDLSLLVLNNKPIFFGCSYPPAERGIWNPEKVVADCKKQRFEYIISLLRYPVIPQLNACIHDQYELERRFGFYYVYGRKKSGTQVSNLGIPAVADAEARDVAPNSK